MLSKLSFTLTGLASASLMIFIFQNFTSEIPGGCVDLNENLTTSIPSGGCAVFRNNGGSTTLNQVLNQFKKASDSNPIGNSPFSATLWLQGDFIIDNNSLNVPRGVWVRGPVSLGKRTHLLFSNGKVLNLNGDKIGLQNIDLSFDPRVTDGSVTDTTKKALINIFKGSSDVSLLGLNLKYYDRVVNQNVGVRFLSQENISPSKGIKIIRSSFDGFGVAIQASGLVENLQISKNKFSAWTDFAVYIGASESECRERNSSGIQLLQNAFSGFEGATGSLGGSVRGVVRVSKGGKCKPLISRVDVNNNTVVGNGGYYTTVDGETVAGTAHADQIVLHGVDQFNVIGNKVSRGGENGLSVNNFSQNGIIRNNYFSNNDGHAITVGSMFYDFSVNLPHQDAEFLMSRIENGEILRVRSQDFVAGRPRVDAHVRSIRLIKGSEQTGEYRVELGWGHSKFWTNDMSEFYVESSASEKLASAQVGEVFQTKNITITLNTSDNDRRDYGRSVEDTQGILSGVFVAFAEGITLNRNSLIVSDPVSQQHSNVTRTCILINNSSVTSLDGQGNTCSDASTGWSTEEITLKSGRNLLIFTGRKVIN